MTTQHPDLSVQLHGEQQEISIVTLTRPAKRNALNDGLILAIRDAFQNLPASVKAAVIDGEGEHFCAGLDQSELSERDAAEGVFHSRMWHAALDCVEKGTVPGIAALHGAVVGGGLELASACHIRVAHETSFYGMRGCCGGTAISEGATCQSGCGDKVRARMICCHNRNTAIQLVGQCCLHPSQIELSNYQAL